VNTLKKIVAFGHIFWILLSGFLLAATAQQASSSNLPGINTLPGNEIVNGGAVAVVIDMRPLNSAANHMQIRFRNRTLPVNQHPLQAPGVFYALVGIPLSSKAGSYKLEFEWTAAGKRHSRLIPLRTVEGKYRIDKLTVDSGKVNLSEKDLARVKKEKQEIKRIYANGSAARLWHGNFQLPTHGDVTSPFGNKRMFNDQLRSFHRGVDFRAPEGTPIFAANTGVVRLAKNLFFSGNIAIVDHGSGIFTNYAHLSRIKVKPGQKIEKGQLVGLSGATGRVSGPHLHWGLKVNGVYVNPLQFVEVISLLIGH
jgi:murein DD-endopeptidase MepM/ murein hydrolase activator NlpD